MGEVYQRLKQYYKKRIYPFHMPGHKRIERDIFSGYHPYQMDYTEVDGLDDLHEPEEMYRQSMDRMKMFYHTRETFYLVNGSTSGIMAAIAAVCNLGDKIIVTRNCHKSVYKAIELLGLDPIYVYPELEQENGIVINISIEKIREVVDKHTEAKAFVLVSPTYEGTVMNVKAIADIVHRKQISLIVDEAHGAHFPFGKDFPETAIKQGADIVIQSLHKTMPALTQTALLHVCTDCVAVDRIKKSIDCFETTSPSYLLAASIDDAFQFGVENEGRFHEYFCELQKLYQELEQLKYLYVLRTDDPGKIVISTAKTIMTGKQLYDILLKKYGLQMEMAQENYCLAMTSVCDTRDGIERLISALKEIDGSLAKSDGQIDFVDKMPENECSCIPYQAVRAEQKEILLEDSVGKVSGEYIYVYPPGIPLIVPGEKIHDRCIRQIHLYRERSLKIRGLIEKNERIYIKVLDQ